MERILSKGNHHRLIVAFHGTGGNLTSLYHIIELIDGQASVLSFLGEVGTGEERRFFNPLNQGKLDIEDFEGRVENFLYEWEKINVSNYDEVVFFGYSNGANFIQGLLQRNPEIADKIILLHPSNFHFDWEQGSEKTRILLTIGSQDPMVVPGEAFQLGKQLEAIFPLTEMKLLDGTHGVSDEEIAYVNQWIKRG